MKKKDETSDLLGKFGFQVKEWYSNNSKIGTTDKCVKGLGINWDCTKDKLLLAYPDLKIEINLFIKRNVLSVLASIWDPMGFCAGDGMKSKLIFQLAVRLKQNWDDKIDDPELFQKWETWLSQLSQLMYVNVVIGRPLLPTKNL